MFMPTHLIGHGYGKILWSHAVKEATFLGNRVLVMSDPEAIGFYTAMGATLERHQEVAPGFSLGVLWYNLR
jgi:ABC-type nitrate/sulfonate/bicarbonate transport system ATPase subunit